MYNKIIFRNGVNANNQYFKDLNRFAPEVTANNATQRQATYRYNLNQISTSI